MYSFGTRLSFLYSHRISYFVRTLKAHSAKRIFSGIQPTGAPHLGNYFGAIKKWATLQDDGNECIFSIVDLHSITLPQDQETLRQNINLMAACILACGIKPDVSLFFLQSQVPQHVELAKILGCLMTVAKLSRLPQYKEKSSMLKDIPLGLYLYPLLQSADILLYKTTEVPVGEDQVQHIQLAQHLARVFNNKYGEVFPVPSVVIDVDSGRIKSLQQPDKKMSKSDLDVRSRIQLTDDPDIIREKVRASVPANDSSATKDHPGIRNLIQIYNLCSATSDSILDKQVGSFTEIDCCKENVAEAIIEYLKPIQRNIKEFTSDPLYISHVLDMGSIKAAEIASKTLEEVKNVIGLSINCQA